MPFPKHSRAVQRCFSSRPRNFWHFLGLRVQSRTTSCTAVARVSEHPATVSSLPRTEQSEQSSRSPHTRNGPGLLKLPQPEEAVPVSTVEGFKSL